MSKNLSQHNPDGDKKLSPPEPQHLHINFGQTNFAQKLRFGAYGEITLYVSTLQNGPGNSQSVFQFSLASENEDDEAEYQTYRRRAQVLPDLGLASISFPGTGGSADATRDLASALRNLPDFAQAHFAQQFMFGAHSSPKFFAKLL